MKLWKSLAVTLAIGVPVPAFAATAATAATVYKSPTCSCCAAYVDILKKNGFEVDVVSRNDMQAVKDERGVPEHLTSCHTTVIGRYTFEGHIPLESVDKVLKEQPMIAGLAVPGMPMGSPGMGGPKRGPINVYYLSPAAEPRLYEQR